MTEHTPITRPLLAQVETLPFEQVRLTLADGQAVTLDLEALPRAVLYPLLTQPGEVFTPDWADHTAPAYRVPAHLGASLRAAFHLRRVSA